MGGGRRNLEIDSYKNGQLFMLSARGEKAETFRNWPLACRVFWLSDTGTDMFEVQSHLAYLVTLVPKVFVCPLN